jgi:hypothetical protein
MAWNLPEDWGLPCEPPAKRVVERLDEPIDEAARCCLQEGRPCMLFASWDYAEDWSGTFVRAMPHAVLRDAPVISREEFWALVRQLHGIIDDIEGGE